MKPVFIVLVVMGMVSCKGKAPVVQHKDEAAPAIWKQDFDKRLSLLGHRNWVLVVDAAFPLQTSPGITYINADEKLLPALAYIHHKLQDAGHVKPIIYKDRELDFIAEDMAPGVADYKMQLGKLLNGQPVQTLLHNRIFEKLDSASRLFSVVVVKTKETIPYSSVFMELDCKYWSDDKEQVLRKLMRQE